MEVKASKQMKDDQDENKTHEDNTPLPQIINKQNNLYQLHVPDENERVGEFADIEQAISNDIEPQEPQEGLLIIPNSRKCTKKRIVLSILFLLIASSLLVVGYIFEGKINSQIDIISDWVKDNQAASYFILITAYIIGIVVWIPGAIFMIFGSFIWGRVHLYLIIINY